MLRSLSHFGDSIRKRSGKKEECRQKIPHLKHPGKRLSAVAPLREHCLNVRLQRRHEEHLAVCNSQLYPDVLALVSVQALLELFKLPPAAENYCAPGLSNPIKHAFFARKEKKFQNQTICLSNYFFFLSCPMLPFSET